MSGSQVGLYGRRTRHDISTLRCSNPMLPGEGRRLPMERFAILDAVVYLLCPGKGRSALGGGSAVTVAY